jgi:hypothetical protein
MTNAGVLRLGAAIEQQMIGCWAVFTVWEAHHAASTTYSSHFSPRIDVSLIYYV